MITIEQIKAECRLAIELGERASKGPWTVLEEKGSHSSIDVGCGQVVVQTENVPHIAHARTFSPASARVVLERIDFLEQWGTAEDKHYQFQNIRKAFNQ